MTQFEQLITRQKDESIDDFIKRAGTTTGRMQGICSRCDACGSSRTENSSAEYSDQDDFNTMSAILYTITGEVAGTRRCPLTISQN